MRTAAVAFAISLLLSSAPGHAAPRAPTGKWVMDFGDKQCVAARNYGTDQEPLMLVLKQPTEGEIVQLAIIRKGSGSGMFANQLNGKIRVDDGPTVAASMIRFTAKARGEQVISTNLPFTQFAALRKGQALAISAGAVNVSLQLTSVEPLMKLMDECVVELRKLWNADEAAADRIKQPVVGSLAGLFRFDDYPGIAIEQSKGGTVGLLVLINEQGRVADCTVIETSGVAALDSQSCAVIAERARFKPAIGVDGKPAKSTFRQRVTWRIDS